jgi:uncharacterized protein (UPF0276 family)
VGAVDARDGLTGSGPPGPSIGFSYNGGHTALLDRVLPLVDYVEVTPDTIAVGKGREAQIDPGSLRELRAVASSVKVVVHGVGMSIGSHDGMSERYLRLLDQIFEAVPVEWHSEHLGYVNVDGVNLGTMVAVPRTMEALELVCGRVRYLQERYPLPFLLENVVHVLPERAAEMNDAEFLNAIVERTGCGLLLDVYNLECDAHNQGFDVPRFIEQLDLEAVREIHVAGGVEYKDFLLDIHSRPVRESTLALTREVVARCPSIRLVTFEVLDEAVPVLGDLAIEEELARLHEALAPASHGPVD